MHRPMEALDVPAETTLFQCDEWPAEYEGPGEACVEAYLTDPELYWGCNAHADPDCLCDVDVSKTAGMTFDKVPPELAGVVDTEDLIRAGAQLWMDYDLIRGFDFDMLHQHGSLLHMEREDIDRLVVMVKDRASIDEIKEVFSGLSNNEIGFIRRVCGTNTPNGAGMRRLRCSEAKVLQLHNEGLSIHFIIKRIEEEDGIKMQDKTIRRWMQYIGITPNVMGNTRWRKHEAA